MIKFNLTKILSFLEPLRNSMQKKNKLLIIYRHTPLVSAIHERPDWFCYESCFLSLLKSFNRDSLENFDIKLTILFDGDLKSWNENFISSYIDFKNIQFEYQIFHGGSQKDSTWYALDYAAKNYNQGYRYIYFLENDYVHDPSWLIQFAEIIRANIPFDYLSLYDHPDKYEYSQSFHPFHKGLTSRIYTCGDRYWRSAPSTCGSYIVKTDIFEKDFSILKSGLMDHLLFDQLALKERILLTPLPGLATHCMTRFLSPYVNWKLFADK